MMMMKINGNEDQWNQAEDIYRRLGRMVVMRTRKFLACPERIHKCKVGIGTCV